MDRPLILGVSGSPRKNGNSDTLLRAILEGAKQTGCDTESVYLRDCGITPCIGCERCRKVGTCTRFQDGMHLLYPKLDQAAGLVLVSPVYNYNVTAQMKAFIDRLYPYYIFTNDHPRKYKSRWQDSGKKATVAAVAEQMDPADMGFTIEAMSMPLKALAVDVVGELRALGFFEKGIVKRDEGLMDEAHALGRTLAAKL